MAATVYITQVHMAPGGTGHEHIEEVQWTQSGNAGKSSRSQMVDFINQNPGSVKVTDGRNTVDVGVVSGKWLRTHADGKWTDNLLALPRY